MLQLVSESEVAAHHLSALYVGPDAWTLPWLPGRTVDTTVAAAAIRAGEALRRCPAVDNPVWSEIHAGAQLLGVTAHYLAAVLEVACTVPAPALERTRRRHWLPGTHRIGGAR